MTVDSSGDEVRAAINGRVGVITLDRPKALNALTLSMVRRLGTILDDWAKSPDIDAVLIRSASERAFCAGGDMRAIGSVSTPAARMARGRAFFEAEYRVNYRINTYPKPYIALLHGVAMGGGLGISIHGSCRIVSETVQMAMPEILLGLFPDVGASWFLNRCPGFVGRYLALIGPRLGAADALWSGLATHHVPRASFDGLVKELGKAGSLDDEAVADIIDKHAAAPSRGTLAGRAPEIADLFHGEDLDGVVQAIEHAANQAPWIAEAQSVLRRASPTSLRATWRRMVHGKGHTIGRVLAEDYRMAVRMVGGHDFAEGVRAVLLDKDQSPRWQPPTLAAVSEADIDALLAPMEAP